MVTTPSAPQPTLSTSTTGGSPTTTSAGGNTGTCAAVPGNINLVANSKLPDPFKLISGSRITTKADWKCRRNEISELIQRYELGTKPPKPSSLTASLSGNTLTITAGEGGKSVSFTVTITYPSSGTAPYPAIIGYGGGSIPIPAGVAKISFNNDDMGGQSGTRGVGKFFQLYGSGHSAGSIMAWAWGVSRIIDALEITPSARINTARIGVTGCSRNGKGALAAGAFDERIALTIPQESGSGGSACWRLSEYQKSQGTNVQTASHASQEQPWFSSNFNSYVSAANINRLPHDHHMLAGLVAPRGLLIIDNTSMEWLGNLASFGCMKVAQEIYKALGESDAMGVSQKGHADHCGFPSSQQQELTAFVNKFLLGGSANTAYSVTDGNFNFQQSQFVDWTTPTLA